MRFWIGRSGWLSLLVVATVSVLAVAAGTLMPAALASNQGTMREFTIEASKFSYSPHRISVNQGDTVVLRLRPQDVSHGLYLDGYACPVATTFL